MKKIKQSIALILCMALLLSWTPATSLAEEESSAGEEISGVTEDGFVWKLWENEYGTGQSDKIGERVRITGYTGEKGEITIPLEIEGYQVSAINAYAFQNNETITDVTIPEGIIGIGFDAFATCPNLRRVSVPSTILRWRDEGKNHSMTTETSTVFAGCTALEEVILAEGLPVLDTEMFKGCTSLKKIKVPDSVDISQGLVKAFMGASGLEEVELPEGMTLIGESCFGGAGLKSFAVPDGVTEIGYGAFKDCANLITIKIPDSVTIIGRNAFRSCTSLEHINLSKELKSIAYEVFKYCTSLKSVSIPAENIGWIPDDAFPEGVTVYLPLGSKTETAVKSIGTVTIADITEHPNHEYETVVTKEPTCEETGIETGICRICGAVGSETEIPATGHSYGNWTKETEATCTKAGSESRTCTICKKKETRVVSAKGHQYETTKVVPATTKAEGYTLKTCKVCHTQTKDQITPKLKPLKKVSLKKLASPKKGTIKVQWKKLSGVTGYQIQIGTNKKVTKNKKVINIKKAKTVKKTIKKLKSGKTYYVKIRAYQTVDGKKVYGAWSKAKRVKVK